MKTTKNLKKAKLQVEREVLRVLQDHELRHVEGGRPAVTGDSVNVCCA